MTQTTHPEFGWRELTTKEGRRNAPVRVRAACTFAAVAALHLLGIGLLGYGLLTTPAGVLTLGLAVFAYTRGWIHSLDADHIAMIDNSTRRFIARGDKPTSIGLAFSAGHSTVVIGAGIAVVAGAGWIREAADPESSLGQTLGLIGASVSAAYLLLIAAANVPALVAAARSARSGELRDLNPGGLFNRVLSAPLSKVTHPGHIYIFGALFGLGFDTASTLATLMLTGAAGVAGVPPLPLLSLPVLFAAGMTLGDSVNQMIMLRVYTAAVSDHTRARFNLAVTAVSVVAASAVAILTLAGIATETLGAEGVVAALAEIDTQWWGVGILAVFLTLTGLWWFGVARRARAS